MSWKLVGPIVALALAGCSAQVTVRSAPPPERVETVTAAPSAQHFWVKGHWQYNGERYAWVPGRWEARRVNAVWAPGHWRRVSGGWVWVEGRWLRR